MAAFVWIAHKDAANDLYVDKTNGCGYCKKSHIWTHICHNFKWNTGIVGEDFISWKYHVGGNYYRIDLRTLS